MAFSFACYELRVTSFYFSPPKNATPNHHPKSTLSKSNLPLLQLPLCNTRESPETHQRPTRDPPKTHPFTTPQPTAPHTKSHPNPHPKNNRLPYQKNYVILHLNLSSNRFSKTIGKNNNHSNSNSSTRKYKKHNFNHLPTINTTTHKA